MTVVGGMLLTIGAAHLALGAVWFHSTFDAMAAGELVGSAQRTWGASQTDAERDQVFWFQVTGIALLLLGCQIEILARTGMRKGELLGLTVDAVVQIGSAYWLRIPIGKLHNDRYIPLHPQLKTMIDDWLADRPDWQDSLLLFTDRGRPIPGTRVDTQSAKPPPPPASATSTLTSCGTPWPLRPSTAA